MDRWLVIGANGALGTDLLDVFGKQAIAATRSNFDMTHKDDMYTFIKGQPIIGVINTAAFHNVPLCEKQSEQAFHVNAMGVKNLSELCSYLKLHLIHISTDYVFDGKKREPYVESDIPRPLSTYAISKLAGEYMVQAYASKWTIIRSCGLYGKIPTRAKKGNFITSIVNQALEGGTLKVVNDEVVTPTCTWDLAKAIEVVAHGKHEGLFHINQAGETTWYEFAKTILDVLELKNPIEPISRNAFPSTVNRPDYSILNIDKFQKETGYKMAPWKEALTRFLLENRPELVP